MYRISSFVAVDTTDCSKLHTPHTRRSHIEMASIKNKNKLSSSNCTQNPSKVPRTSEEGCDVTKIRFATHGKQSVGVFWITNDGARAVMGVTKDGSLCDHGGKKEAGDVTPWDTACRESREELGISPEPRDVIGMCEINRGKHVLFVCRLAKDIDIGRLGPSRSDSVVTKKLVDRASPLRRRSELSPRLRFSPASELDRLQRLWDSVGSTA
mgnify:CR=1 FL=1